MLLGSESIDFAFEKHASSFSAAMRHILRSNAAQLTQQCCTTCASMLRKKWQCVAQKFVLWLAILTDIFEQEKGYYMLLDP
jgi:hypothetical protein